MARLEVPRLIARKRDGGELTAQEWSALVTGYLDDEVAEAQMAALLMAGVLRGFTDAEAVALTDVLLASGDRVDLSDLDGPTVDKHSTGGVGDTTTLVLAPLLAELSTQVAKLSGRGLGHTGGTLDKLESIPGFRTELTLDELRSQVQDVGVAVAAATADLVPADKRLYALRDVTATVPAPALIAASVMSKKLAGGADHVVLDVKAGDGAFASDVDAAERLARTCVAIGGAHGRAVAAIVTDMDQPLGPAVGNALEVRAAVDVLAGAGDPRLSEIVVELAATACSLTGRDRDEAAAAARQLLADGSALERFGRWVQAQGGDRRVVDDPDAVLPSAPVIVSWTPARTGTVATLHTRRLGELAGRLGAGRMRPGDDVDPAVGLVVDLDVGTRTGPDGPGITVHARTQDDADGVVAALEEAVELVDGDVERRDLVLARVEQEDP